MTTTELRTDLRPRDSKPVTDLQLGLDAAEDALDLHMRAACRGITGPCAICDAMRRDADDIAQQIQATEAGAS
jgi:hypothetical protein